MARLLLVVAAALILCGVASAATIDDLRALGYSVQISNPGQNGCPIYYISGHGLSSYFTCDDQAAINSYANPVAICNADWQINHPDQLDAFHSIANKGWSISGDQCANIYNVTNPNDNTTAYSGEGAGLVGFNDQHGAPPAAQGPVAAPVTPPQNCLPLCPNPGDTRGAGGEVIPAPTPVAVVPAASPLQAAVTAALNPPSAPDATPVDPSSYTVVPATDAELAANPDVLGWLNTPYMTTPLLSQ